MTSRWIPIAVAVTALGVGGCAGSSGGAAVEPSASSASTMPTASPSGAPTPTATASVAAAACRTRDLDVSLGPGNGAAGSVYEPIVFTNTGGAACTLEGYPGVSYVAPGSGDQVGTAASRDRQHEPTLVTLAPGERAQSVLRLTNHSVYDPDACQETDVSGVRVYPPGERDAAYVPFDSPAKACSTDVRQLTVTAVTVADG